MKTIRSVPQGLRRRAPAPLGSIPTLAELKAVRLSFRPRSDEDQPPKLMVKVSDARTGELICADTPKQIDQWLSLLGYRYAVGTNGVWVK